MFLEINRINVKINIHLFLEINHIKIKIRSRCWVRFHLLENIILLLSDNMMLLPFCLKSNFTPRSSSSSICVDILRSLFNGLYFILFKNPFLSVCLFSLIDIIGLPFPCNKVLLRPSWLLIDLEDSFDPFVAQYSELNSLL